jgi:hypothetical protein
VDEPTRSPAGKKAFAEGPRWLAPLFLIVALLQLGPIWSVRYLPTSDGPEHLYNSWILHDLVFGNENNVTKVYRIESHPFPNWSGHVLMAALMVVVPPLVAEKLLFSTIVLLFLAGAWMLAGAVDRRGQAYAFLAFPFAYHLLLQAGFYNFSLGAALFPIVLAVWWRRRDRPDAKTIVLVALLLLVSYFSHPLPAVLAGGSVALLWLCTFPGRPWRRHLLHLLALIPVMAMLIWFALQRGEIGATGLHTWNASQTFQFLARTQILFTFDTRQMAFGYCMFAIYLLLIVATVMTRIPGGRRIAEADAFLLLTLLFLVLYVVAPDAAAGGSLVRERIALLIYFLPLPWFSPDLPRRAIRPMAIVLALVAAVNAAFLLHRYRTFDRLITQFVRSTAPIPAGTTLLPLNFERQPRDSYVGYLVHAAAYAAIERRLIDLDNYEARTGYFPISFRSDFEGPAIATIEGSPTELNVDACATRAGYIMTWEMPRYSLIQERIEKRYALVSESGSARIYRSLRPQRMIGRRSFVLLPLAGTVSAVGGPAGSWFQIEQQMRNVGTSPVHVDLNTCWKGDCDLELMPGESVPLASADPSIPFIFVRLDPKDAKDVFFATVVHRTDGVVKWSPIAIQPVYENAFQRHQVEIARVPWRDRQRINIRVWVLGELLPMRFMIRIRSATSGALLGDKNIDLDPTGYFTNGDLRQSFQDVREPWVSLAVEAEGVTNDTRLWAFVTVSDYMQNAATVYLPRTGCGSPDRDPMPP